MSGKKLTKGEIKLRQVFSTRVITALAQILYERAPKILAKKTNKRKRILVKAVQDFVRANAEIRDRIYGLTENHDREATVQILAQDPELLRETVGPLFNLPGPTATPSITPSATPSAVPSATKAGLPALEKVDDQGLEEGEIIESNNSIASGSTISSTDESVISQDAQPLLGLNLAPNVPNELTESQVNSSLFREERLRERNERKERARLARQGPQGDPTTDINREADIGAPSNTSGSTVEGIAVSQGSTIGSSTSSSGEPISEADAARRNVGSQPRGLGLRPDQINHAIRNIPDEEQRQVARELLGRGNIDFNRIVEALGQSSIIALLSSALSPSLRLVMLPVIRGALPLLRETLGIDFNRYFTGDALIPNPAELVTLDYLGGTEDINEANINLLVTLRNTLLNRVEQGLISQGTLDQFNRVTNQRYFIYVAEEPEEGVAVDEESLARVTQFQQEEANFIQRASNILVRELSRDQADRAISEALRDYTVAYNSENGQSLIYDNQQAELIRQNANLIPVDYLDLATRINRNVNVNTLFNNIQDAIILSSNNDEVVDLLNRNVQGTMNGFSANFAFINNEDEFARVEALGLDNIQERRNTLGRQADARSLRNTLMAGAALSSAGAIGTALYRGFSIGDIARMVSSSLPGSAQNAFYTWAMLKGLEYLTGVPFPSGTAESAAAAAGLATSVQNVVSATPVPIPPDTLEIVQQEGSKGKGTLRPKFILPSTSILDKTDNEKQADYDEWAMFDFVLPTSEGAEGNANTNPLKRLNLIEHSLNLQGGGQQIDVPLGMQDLPSNNELKVLALGPEIPPMKFNDAYMGDNPFEQTPTYAGYPLDIPDYKNPYEPMTKTIQMDEDIRKSVLYGWVP